MADDRDTLPRTSLPIPDQARKGLITYDAKDPDTKYPPIQQLRPPKGAPNVLVILIDDVGIRRVERLRRPVPDAERRAAGGRRPEVQPLPHHRALLADAPGAADRTQSPLGRHGRHHRDRDAAPRATARCCPNTASPLARDAEAERLRHRAVRQVPRSAGVGDEPGRSVRRLADRRRRLRVLLRLHRRRGAPVVPVALRRHDADRGRRRRPKRAIT